MAAQRTVAAFVGTLLRNPNDVEEVLQRVAVTLVRRYESYDPARPFTAWAIGVAKLEVKSFRRQRMSSRVQVVDDVLLDQIAASYERLSDDRPSVQDALSECVRRLDPRSRRLIHLRYAEASKPAAIAQTLGLSSGAVRTCLSKARAALRACVERRLRAHPGAF